MAKRIIIKPLGWPDSIHLNAARGWVELGNHFEANDELENISPISRVHPDVLEIRLDIYQKEKMWNACVDIATALMTMVPERAKGWLSLSYALHELGRTQEARDNLSRIAAKFPKVWQIPYNLACYYSCLGQFNRARHWLKKAMVLEDKIVPKKAIDDPDLLALWDDMSTTIPKKEFFK